LKQVLIVKNCSREGPGLFETLLREFRIPFLVRDIEKGDDFPTPIGYGALIILGGPQSANDQNPTMKIGLSKIKEAVDHQVPILGICLGLQMLVKACGGKVARNRIKEIGFRDPEGAFFEVEFTHEGMREPLLKNISSPFKLLQLHGETVELTPDMTLLGNGKYCQNQIVKAGPLAYGIQGHLEITEELFQKWMQEDPDLLDISKSDLNKDFSLSINEISKSGRDFITNFFCLASLID
jgi:GMP synthase-like glutamine amidotransferase